MAKRGRPVSVYTQERLKQIEKNMDKYTDETDIPILAEFAYKNDIIREELYKHPELSYAIKKMMCKKEAQLEKLALMNVVNPSMAVFSLKQLGWTDKQIVETNVSEIKELTESIKNSMT